MTRILPSPNSGNGLVQIRIRLWDAEGNASLPMLQYQRNGTTNWLDATIRTVNGINYSRSLRVPASPTGSQHDLIWDAAADLATTGTNHVLLRARAMDVTLFGEWSEPMPYTVQITQDTDGDGLPDWWENAWTLNPSIATGVDGASGDPDLDGFSNWSEYMADTNPRDGASYL